MPRDTVTADRFAPGDPVIHRNAHRSYGHGRFVRTVPSPTGRPAAKAYARFEGESADRLIWLDDLRPDPMARRVDRAAAQPSAPEAA